MFLAPAAWLSTNFDYAYLALADQIKAAAHRHRWLIAFLVVGFSIGDLLLTQTILTEIHGDPRFSKGEANFLMAPIVMTWWIWPIRVGIPILAVIRDIRAKNYNLMLFAAVLYGAVCAWNSYQYHLVQKVL